MIIQLAYDENRTFHVVNEFSKMDANVKTKPSR